MKRYDHCVSNWQVVAKQTLSSGFAPSLKRATVVACNNVLTPDIANSKK